MEREDIYSDIYQIIKTLMELDVHCEINENQADIVLLGGSAILFNLFRKDLPFRPTNDIDIEIIATLDENQLYDSLNKVNIELVGGVMEVPPKEDLKDEKNLCKLKDQGFDNINVYVADLEILACCKIFSKRQKDLDDLRNTDLLVECNKEKLLEMVEEYKMFLLNENDPDLNLKKLGNIFSEKGI